MQNKKAFTLIEILIVIAIMGVLAGIILVSTSNSMQKARDSRRKSDLTQIGRAYMQNFANTGSYIVSGTGWNGGGAGWFNYAGGSYPASMASGLENLGYFSKAPIDPSLSLPTQGTSGSGAKQYMKYPCSKGFCIYAKLESPTQDDLDAMARSETKPGCSTSLDTSYGMNYAQCYE